MPYSKKQAMTILADLRQCTNQRVAEAFAFNPRYHVRNLRGDKRNAKSSA